MLVDRQIAPTDAVVATDPYAPIRWSDVVTAYPCAVFLGNAVGSRFYVLCNHHRFGDPRCKGPLHIERKSGRLVLDERDEDGFGALL